MLVQDKFKVNVIQSATYHDNVSNVLCNVYDLDESYKSLLRQSLNKPLKDNMLSPELRAFLKMPYDKNSKHAATKFKAEASLAYVEEMQSVAMPVLNEIEATCSFISKDRSRAYDQSSLAYYQFHVQKDKVIADGFDSSGNFIIVKSVDLKNTDPFVVYQASCEILNNGDYKFYASQCDIVSKFDERDKITVFRKPNSREFENWCRLARDLYKMDNISEKVFDPLDNPPENGVQLKVNVSRVLHPVQLSAVDSLLNQHPRNVFVLFGPPGTGKTYTLVTAIEAIKKAFELKNQKFRFLICAHSNMAADNFAIALIKSGIFENSQMFRAYSSHLKVEDCHPLIKPITYTDPKSFPPRYCLPYNSTLKKSFLVVICTIGYHQKLLKAYNSKTFSHIYVDEAGQARDAEVIMPLLTFGNVNTKFAIAGDPKQLDPVITSEILSNPEYNSALSTLARLCDKKLYERFLENERNHIMLVMNFRSHPDITNLISTLFYESKLMSSAPRDCYDYVKRQVCLGNKDIPILFWALNGKEEQQGSSMSFKNTLEANAVFETINILMKYKQNNECEKIRELKESDIGVVTPYKDNVNEIKYQLNQDYPNVTVGSVEKYQGSERAVIIFSAVRTEGLGFLSDPKRLCTAISRPRKFLVIIGYPKLLVQDEKWKEMITILYKCDCICPGKNDKIWNNIL